MTALQTIFMGTPDLACVILRELLKSTAVQIIAVVTQMDKPKGRDLVPQPSPVKKLAGEAGIPVLQPQRARNPDFVRQLESLRPDLILVAAYGQILPPAILDLPRLGCVNVHTSLLPKYRGAAPIQWAILNGDSETGVTLMQMDAGLDTGPILSQASCPITDADTSESLHARLAELGASLLVQTIPDIEAGKIKPHPQPENGVSYAPKIKKEDGRLDWSQPARILWNRVRGLTPWPGTFTFLAGGAKPVLLKIWRAEPANFAGAAAEILAVDKTGITVGCGSGSLKLLELQREGGRRLKASEFLAGLPLKPGQHFE
jgi:methionyl-tRNA formyltransferase